MRPLILGSFHPNISRPANSITLRNSTAPSAQYSVPKVYEAQGRKIWNATRGKLEVFERIPLEEALEQ